MTAAIDLEANPYVFFQTGKFKRSKIWSDVFQGTHFSVKEYSKINIYKSTKNLNYKIKRVR